MPTCRRPPNKRSWRRHCWTRSAGLTRMGRMTMPDPAVVVAMRQFKLDLLARETRQMGTMARRWLQVERALEGNITALAEQMARIRADGGTVTRGMLFSMDRYHALLAQLRVEVGQYSAYAAELIEAEQLRHGRLGIQHAARAIELAGPASLRGAFDVLPVDAIEFMAGHVADGTPLRLYLEQTWGDA